MTLFMGFSWGEKGQAETWLLDGRHFISRIARCGFGMSAVAALLHPEMWNLILAEHVTGLPSAMAAGEHPQRPSVQAQEGSQPMPKFIIERDMPGVGAASAQDMQGAAKTSCDVLRQMGPEIQWVESYVTGDKIYCVYVAPNEDMIREHAKRGGLPANRVSKVERIIDPTTSEVTA